MAQFPTELVERIIDLVAELYPESLPTCALISQQWNPRSTFHLENVFHHPKITTLPELHAFVDTIKTHQYLARRSASLEISPDPELSRAFTSYIPFLHLCSRTLPYVTRLFLGDTLRWTHYPPLYNNGAVGRSFHAVTTLDLSCRFKSVQDLFRAVRSFENVEAVRLLHPDPFLSPTAAGKLGPNASFELKLRRPLRPLEVPLSVLLPVLKVAGDHVVDLSIHCPPPSVLSMLAVDKPALLTPPSSFLALKTVSITVPAEPHNPSHTGLQKLRRLALAPIRKHGAVFSLFLLSCGEHRAVGHRLEGTSKTGMRRVVQSPATMIGPLEECQECHKREEAIRTLRRAMRQRDRREKREKMRRIIGEVLEPFVQYMDSEERKEFEAKLQGVDPRKLAHVLRRALPNLVPDRVEDPPHDHVERAEVHAVD